MSFGDSYLYYSLTVNNQRLIGIYSNEGYTVHSRTTIYLYYITNPTST